MLSISSFSHPDNALEVCGFLTPLHIVPEWYFLCQYAMLKAVPNKNAGFIILLTSIFTFFYFGEIRNLTTFTRLMDYNNGFSLSFFFNLFLSFLWIGAQFPQTQKTQPQIRKDHWQDTSHVHTSVKQEKKRSKFPWSSFL